MAYDQDLVDRIREALQGQDDVTEKKMFGGHAFLLGGHMAVAASGQGGLMVRVDPDESDELAVQDGVELFEMRGRAMSGWLHVEQSATSTDDELAGWVARGVAFVATLPPK